MRQQLGRSLMTSRRKPQNMYDRDATHKDVMMKADARLLFDGLEREHWRKCDEQPTQRGRHLSGQYSMGYKPGQCLWKPRDGCPTAVACNEGKQVESATRRRRALRRQRMYDLQQTELFVVNACSLFTSWLTNRAGNSRDTGT